MAKNVTINSSKASSVDISAASADLSSVGRRPLVAMRATIQWHGLQPTVRTKNKEQRDAELVCKS